MEIVSFLTQFLPHCVMRLHESLVDGLEDGVVVVQPEVLLANDQVHQVVLKQEISVCKT